MQKLGKNPDNLALNTVVNDITAKLRGDDMGNGHNYVSYMAFISGWSIWNDDLKIET